MTSYIPEMYTNPEGVYMAQKYSVLRPTHFFFYFGHIYHENPTL